MLMIKLRSTIYTKPGQALDFVIWNRSFTWKGSCNQLPFTFTCLYFMIKISTCFVLLISFYASSAWGQKPVDSQRLAHLYSKQPNQRSVLTDTGHYYLIRLNQPTQSALKSLRVHKRVAYNYFIVSALVPLQPNATIAEVNEANSLWKAADNLVQQYQQHPKSTAQIDLVTSPVTESLLTTLSS